MKGENNHEFIAENKNEKTKEGRCVLLFPLSRIHSSFLEDSVIIACVNAYVVTFEKARKMNEKMKEGKGRE